MTQTMLVTPSAAKRSCTYTHMSLKSCGDPDEPSRRGQAEVPGVT